VIWEKPSQCACVITRRSQVAGPQPGSRIANGTWPAICRSASFFRDEGPETAIRVAMETIEADQSFRVPVRVSDIIIAGLIVDGGYLAAGSHARRPNYGM
jgi:hypothetical protein